MLAKLIEKLPVQDIITTALRSPNACYELTEANWLEQLLTCRSSLFLSIYRYT